MVAACRDPSSAADLNDLATAPENKGRLEIVELDVTEQASVEHAAEYVKANHGVSPRTSRELESETRYLWHERLGRRSCALRPASSSTPVLLTSPSPNANLAGYSPWAQLLRQRLDLLFNVAGILGDGKNTPGPERSLRAMDREWLRQTLEVNAVGPMMLAAKLAPLLESPAKRGQGETARPPSVVVNFSARVGSIGDNSLGGWHSYRMSKVSSKRAGWFDT